MTPSNRPYGKPSRSKPRQPPAAPVAPLPIPLGDVPRDLVYRKLSRQVQHFPELLIDELTDESPGVAAMDSRDLAFAHAVYDSVIRRWMTLEHLIQAHLKQPITEIEARLRAVLLAGAAQLVLLDKVPAYACINHAVEWSKERIRPGAGAMVNAVLRRVAQSRAPVLGATPEPVRYTGARNELPLADGMSIRLSGDLLPEDEWQRLAVATSIPEYLLATWSKRLPVQEVRRRAMHTLAAPPTILNTSLARAPLAPEHETLLAPHAVPGHHVFTGNRPELLKMLHARRDIWVQDPASSAVLQTLTGMPSRDILIIDACAGQGTKTRQLAAMFPRAKIVATDVDRRRFEALQSAFEEHETVTVVAPSRLRTDYLRSADLVLLDVPCSNTGVLARRPEAKYRFSDGTLSSLVDTQRQIIADTIPLLRDGSDGSATGRILYSTCSLEPAENDQQGAWVERWHKLTPARRTEHAPAGGPGEPATDYTDGSFALLLR